MAQSPVVRFGVLAFSLNAKGSLIVSFTSAWLMVQSVPLSEAPGASLPPLQKAAGLKYLTGWQRCFNVLLLVFNHAGDSAGYFSDFPNMLG